MYLDVPESIPFCPQVVRSVSALLRYYNWRKFSIVHEDSANFATIAQSLERQVNAEKGFTLNSKSVFQGSLRCCELKKPCCHTSIADILEQTYAKTRGGSSRSLDVSNLFRPAMGKGFLGDK